MATEKNLTDVSPAAPAGFRNSKWQLSPLQSGIDGSTGQPYYNASTYQPNVGGVSVKTGNYTATVADNGLLLSFNSGSAVTLLLPAAAPTSFWILWVQNIGAGALAISPNGLNLDGSASSLSIAQNQGVFLSTDGTNYFTVRGFSLASPLTTKGDLYTRNATVDARLAIGANGTLLVADSTQATGQKWRVLAAADIPNISESQVTGLVGDLAGKAPVFSWVEETPAGAMNGTNVTFTISFAPSQAASLTDFLNGVEQTPSDITVSGATITYTVAPKSTDTHRAKYMH